MSFEILDTTDTFVRAELDTLHWDNPKTTCFWVKYLVDNNTIPTMAVGQGNSHQNNFTRRFTNQGLMRSKVTNADEGYIQSTDGSITVNDWIFIALRRVDGDNGNMYIRKQGLGSFIYQNPFTVTPNPINNERISFGSTDLALDGQVSGAAGFRIAEIGIWDVALSDSDLDQLAAGTTPDNLASQVSALKGYWGAYDVSLTGSLKDNIGTTDLLIYDKVGAIENAGSVPPAVSTDHPISQSATSISVTIVQDSSDTPFASRTTLSYSVFSGVDASALVLEYSGLDGSTDANGIMNILTPNHAAGVNLIVLVFDPSGVNIYAADTLRMTGAATVA